MHVKAVGSGKAGKAFGLTRFSSLRKKFILMFLYTFYINAFSIAIPSLKEGIVIEKAYRTCKIIGRPRDCFHGIINHGLVAEMITS